MKKERLDVFLTEQGFFESRSKAQAVIMAGEVLVNDQKIDKPGTMVKPDAKITLLGKKMPFVSRGGYKLDKSLKVFPISLEGKVVADLGASTGGLRTAPSSMEPAGSTPSTWAMGSWPGNSGRIPGW